MDHQGTHDPLEGAHCTGCGRGCPLSSPSCPTGMAQADEARARIAQGKAALDPNPRQMRIFDTLEEAEEATGHHWTRSRYGDGGLDRGEGRGQGAGHGHPRRGGVAGDHPGRPGGRGRPRRHH